MNYLALFWQMLHLSGWVRGRRYVTNTALPSWISQDLCWQMAQRNSQVYFFPFCFVLVSFSQFQNSEARQLFVSSSNFLKTEVTNFNLAFPLIVLLGKEMSRNVLEIWFDEMESVLDLFLNQFRVFPWLVPFCLNLPVTFATILISRSMGVVYWSMKWVTRIHIPTYIKALDDFFLSQWTSQGALKLAQRPPLSGKRRN